MNPIGPKTLLSRRSLFGIALLGLVTTGLQADPVDVTGMKMPVRVSCVGDSITQGVGAERGKSWPSQLQEMLGEDWKVSNFGLSGTTLMNSGNKPYQKSGRFKAALESDPDVVVIMLGTNDTKPQNWQHFEKDYEKDYRSLIRAFADLETKPQIFLCLPPYIAKDGNWGINERATLAQIPVVTRLSKELKLGLIDVHGALKGRDDLIPDKVHPNTEGAKVITEAVFQALTGKTTPPAE